MPRLQLIKNLKYLLLPLLISCNSGKDISSQNENLFKEKNPQFSQKFEKSLIDIFTEKEILGDFLFAVVNENGLAYSFALNKHILDGNSDYLDNDSPIYIASHTKSFTGTLLKILDERKVIELNTSLAEYLPELTYNDSIDTHDITIKNLLNHTHGTFSTAMAWKTSFLGYSGNNAELINDLNNDFQHDPSGKFRYSNAGPIIAGIVVEKITGSTWKKEMKKYIFKPLEMNRTSAFVSDFNMENIRPSLTISRENKVVHTGFYKKDITMHSSGGIISTVNDLSKWLSANIRQDESLLHKDSWTELHGSTTTQDREYFTYQRTGYSLGWDIAEYQEERILTRFGGLAGISFHISFMPEKNIGIIAFSNDNRAYILPHLMANYAYNLINSYPADSIFRVEKSKFEKSFERESEIEYPNESQLLRGSKVNDNILGTYQNAAGWPAISIDKKDDLYIFNWGILNGKIYENSEGGYSSHLGVMTRDFEIRNDSLKTGSLLYVK